MAFIHNHSSPGSVGSGGGVWGINRGGQVFAFSHHRIGSRGLA